MQKAIALVFALIVVAPTLFACNTTKKARIDETARFEPGYSAPSPGRFVLLPVECTDNVSRGLCSRDVVDDRLRRVTRDLEMDGHTFLASDELLADTRRRVQVGAAVEKWGADFLSMVGGLSAEATFNDLPPSAQQALAESVEADGIIKTSVLFEIDQLRGGGMMEVQMRISDGPDAAKPGATVRCTRSYDMFANMGELYDQEVRTLISCALHRALEGAADPK